MTSSSVLRQRTLHTLFHDGFWKSDHDFQLMIHSNFLADVIVISSLGGDAGRCRRFFMIAFHSNFLYAMHGFRDNEVLLPTGNDVIVISPPGGVSHRFCLRNLNNRPQFPNHSSLLYVAYLLPFRSYSTLHPRSITTTLFSSSTGSSLHQTASFELLCAKIGSRVWAVALVGRTRICCPHVASRPLIGP